MTPRGKKVLIISVSLLAIGGVVGYIFWKKAKDKKDEQAKLDADASANQGGGSTGGNTGGSTGGNAGGSTGGSTPAPTLSNFDAVQKNLNVKADKTGAVNINFNGGKNRVTFFNNNRFAIGIVGQSGYLKKGTYSNGGLTLTIDGGKTISSGSVWTNLVNALK